MTHAGACLCGAISFSVEGPLPAPNACHCVQCRKQSGHYWASVDVDRTALTVTGTPAWFASSDKARRGFCGTCRSFLFWDHLQGDTTAVAMGAFDGPTDTRLALHIFVAQKGDYYDIAGGLPQNAR
ncbi:GFA family protein [Loktanella sp. DJP18]|uniref:GFA family protein n=1 Tax=Loktanella sp. DJP18 TaxID=3409788 RepID=UPI003BB4E16A